MSNQDPLIGKQLGDYHIVDILGQGGMARVYRGYDEKLERYAAVKVFDPRGVTADEMKEYSERFQREARAIARLRHPHIVNVYQSGQSDNILYMAMMLIDGQDLRQVLKDHAARDARLSFQDILRIITDVASALDYAHKEKVIHRDVKPSNIMVTADGHAILTDFGLAL
ncbi:MAG: serine/threonine protein kinase, partial [Anaerolineae bacterium]|nr:serine/threonine protein kinase [Anaerolineae bacterium]